MFNRRDAFSHSTQCDQFFSSVTVTNPGTGKLVAGFEAKHYNCLCWCHNETTLFSSPEPEYDFTPPPEFFNSADAAFVLIEPPEFDTPSGACAERTRGINYLTRPPSEPEYEDIEPVIDPQLASQFVNRSPHELRFGKCDTCGDLLNVCECVE